MQSLCNKIYEVLSVLIDNNIEIAFICETWLSQDTSTVTAIIKQAGYQINHVYREKRGAGVAIIWKKDLENNFKIKCDFKIKTFRSIQYVNIWLCGNTKINLVCLYRYQEEAYHLFLDDLDKLLSAQSSTDHSIILTGDFNVHYEKSDKADVISLENLLNSYGLSQFVQGPTHKKGHTLDLLCANKFEFDFPTIQCKSVNLSDHYPIFFNIPNNCTNVDLNMKPVSRRNIKSIDIDSFKLNMCNTLSNMEFCSDMEFEDHFNLFSNTLLSELDKVAPLQTRTQSAFSVAPPWMDREFKDMRATRRKLERKWRKSGLEEDKTIYIQKRIECAEMSSTKRSDYFGNLIASKEGDQRSLFQIVSKLLDKTQASGILPQHEDSENLASKFNQFYVDKVDNIRNNIPKCFLENNLDFEIFQGTPLESFRPTTVKELREIIKEKPLKASSQDALPASLLKEVIDDLLPYICELVNKSLSTGSVDGVKDSIIIPILKKSGLDPEVLKNYRPVSNLLSIGILIEKVVKIRLSEHMHINNLNIKEQHGYKPFHSTETLLLRLVNDVFVGFESNFVTVLMLLDMSAAFDTVDIQKLLRILEIEIGIKGTALAWFESFLVGRTQKVKIENSFSEKLPVKYGVPQGSVLGPILFNIYTRSLYKLIEKLGFNTSGYADDNNAHQPFALTFQYNIITKELPNLMNQITDWMNSHFLKINPDKTEILLLLPNNLKDMHTINGTFIDDNCIRFSEKAKNLGFIFDKHLNMNAHVTDVVAYCYKLLGDVGRIRNLLSIKQTELLVHAVVSSRLDYCNVLLLGVNKEVIQMFQKVQNAGARLVARIPKFKSVRNTLIDLHWLRVEARVIFKLLLFVFKCVNGLAPSTISDLITVQNPETVLLKESNLQTKYGHRSFSYCAPKYWNCLPLNLRQTRNVTGFKSMTKYFLFNNFETYINNVYKYT